MISQRSSLLVSIPSSLSFDIDSLRSPVLNQPKNIRHIWIITGPAGCGKSSVAAHLAKRLRLPYIEGDEFHPPRNIAKMSAGIPLTDDDRWDWLATLRDKAVEELESGEEGCVVTCSALKRSYRDIIRLAGKEAPDVCVRFLYLQANVELLIKRVMSRQNHFMKEDMVRSQFLALEEPDSSEPDVVAVNVSGTMESVQRATLEKVRLCMAEA